MRVKGGHYKKPEDILESVSGSVKPIVKRKVIQEATKRKINNATLAGEILTRWSEGITLEKVIVEDQLEFDFVKDDRQPIIGE